MQQLQQQNAIWTPNTSVMCAGAHLQTQKHHQGGKLIMMVQPGATQLQSLHSSEHITSMHQAS
jgi:hypothetical protein